MPQSVASEIFAKAASNRAARKSIAASVSRVLSAKSRAPPAPRLRVNAAPASGSLSKEIAKSGVPSVSIAGSRSGRSRAKPAAPLARASCGSTCASSSATGKPASVAMVIGSQSPISGAGSPSRLRAMPPSVAPALRSATRAAAAACCERSLPCGSAISRSAHVAAVSAAVAKGNGSASNPVKARRQCASSAEAGVLPAVWGTLSAGAKNWPGAILSPAISRRS